MSDELCCLYCAKPISEASEAGETQIVDGPDGSDVVRWWCSYHHRDMWAKAGRQDPQSPEDRAVAAENGTGAGTTAYLGGLNR